MENSCKINEKQFKNQENELIFKYEEDHFRSAVYDVDKLIGSCEYELNNNIWNIIHTVVIPGYEGRGIAKKLVSILIEEARKRNIKIHPICSYAIKMMVGKEEYFDVLA